MSDKNFDNFSHYYNEIQKTLREVVLNKRDLNIILPDLISNIQMIEFEIYTSIFDAKEFYNNQRSSLNKKIKQLRKKKKGFLHRLDNLAKKILNLSKPSLSTSILTSIASIKPTIEEIERNLTTLNRNIEEQVLNIEEENKIIEKIETFKREKQLKTTKLIELEKKITIEEQRSDYFQFTQEIELVEKKLVDTTIELENVLKKRLDIHKKMFILYRKAKIFNDIKINVEKQLLDYKLISDLSYQFFNQVSEQNRKSLLRVLSDKHKAQSIPTQKKKRKSSKTKQIIKKRKEHLELREEKLAVALKKQKAGKKLDFYELKLILDSSKEKE